jgi:hypothetical protein
MECKWNHCARSQASLAASGRATVISVWTTKSRPWTAPPHRWRESSKRPFGSRRFVGIPQELDSIQCSNTQSIPMPNSQSQPPERSVSGQPLEEQSNCKEWRSWVVRRLGASMIAMFVDAAAASKSAALAYELSCRGMTSYEMGKCLRARRETQVRLHVQVARHSPVPYCH